MNGDDLIAAMEQQTWAVLAQVSHCLFAHALGRDSRYDLPPTSWTLLEYLERSGPIRVSELAAYHGVEMPTLTPRLKTLEADGFILRGKDPADARASLIEIADKARLAVRRMRQARERLFAQALSGVSEADLRTACAVLETLGRGLEGYPPR
ncbi:hypothetical protein L288_18965 [Sphingobium quisquiliarum P25]|uniref:HTH marR-type domain-containing protein n=1 Tax=Sphingobium quisquiliarum P25 TaxID=1329909 RepID=T0HQG3_9SPHN|nr:MarR family transcriptional regulator [Sphingobium quisquiliarum]EQA99768.1 hypothetical protein L288_18965 [Sphingobium quisquiliarum P25]